METSNIPQCASGAIFSGGPRTETKFAPSLSYLGEVLLAESSFTSVASQIERLADSLIIQK